MKRILTATLALVLFAGAAQAQDSSKHHMKDRQHKGGHEMMVKQLNLSSDQQAKLKSIHEAEQNEMKALKTSSLTAEQSKSQREALRKKYRSQVESVFTAEQKQQLEKMKSERKGKGFKKDGQANRRDRAGKGFQKGAGFQKDLNLTQDQKDRMAKLRTGAKSSFESIRNDKSLTDDQRKEKMKELRKQQEQQMKAILTPEQLEKLKAAGKEQRARNTK